MSNWGDTKLYHYTSFQALEGILNSKEIWLGNLHYMNDCKEMTYFFDELEKSIIYELPNESEKIHRLFVSQHERLKNKTAYAFSLSELYDDAAQWDRYADGGGGVCIRFGAEKLSSKISKLGILQHVFYKNDMNNHQAKALIIQYMINNTIESGFETIDDIFDNIWACSIAFKHPSFREEKEVRICSLPFFDTGKYQGRLAYRVGVNGLREYMPIQIYSESERIHGEVIEEITLGPSAGIDKNLFYRYLKSKYVDMDSISISESKCPLR